MSEELERLIAFSQKADSPAAYQAFGAEIVSLRQRLAASEAERERLAGIVEHETRAHMQARDDWEIAVFARREKESELSDLRAKLTSTEQENAKLRGDLNAATFHAEQYQRSFEEMKASSIENANRANRAQSLAQQAEEEKLGLVVDCERLCTDLEQSLRQWKMYAEERESEDLEKESHAEALSYRAAVKTAKDWRDKAFTLAYPALSSTPTDGRTDGERFEIELSDPEVKWIHGLMCFQCGPIAHVLARNGHDIQRKAEAEQSYVIGWLLKRYTEMGKPSDWREQIDRELNEMEKKRKASLPAENLKSGGEVGL